LTADDAQDRTRKGEEENKPGKTRITRNPYPFSAERVEKKESEKKEDKD